MSQQEKARYFNALKDAGVNFPTHYRNLKTADLKAAYDKLMEGRAQQAQASPGEPTPEQIAEGQRQHALAQQRIAERTGQEFPQFELPPEQPQRQVPVAEANPEEMPGERLNTQVPDQPIRIDPETGREIYQEEVLKPGFAKPRGRRVLRSMESAAVQQTIQDGKYIETFEVAGTGPKQATEIKVTMPSYQTGIVKDPRFPFKIHTYNGVEGFDFFEVAEYYNGAENVPPSCKRMYVENVLCYDMRSVIQTINTEFRQLQLAGRIPTGRTR